MCLVYIPVLNSKIHILSRPVRSGKTTELAAWVSAHPDARGILTPDLDGRRKLLVIGSDRYLDLEAEPGSPDEDTVVVGRFRFSKVVFAVAQQELLSAAAGHAGWMVADELGKLELEHGQGLEPALGQLIRQYQSQAQGRLLLVVRDYLLERVSEHYQLQGAQIHHDLKALV